MKKINSLTGLRFFFIITIVLSHFTFLNDYFDSFAIFANGQFGVLFFFMISGFGLTLKNQTTNSTLLNSKVTLKSSIQFGTKRVSKIYLLYIVTMLLVVPLTIHKTIVTDGQSNILLSIGKVFAKILIAPTLLQSLTGTSMLSQMFNSVAWFLSTIFILYMLYPVLEKFNNKVMKKNPYVWIILIAISGELFRILFRFIGAKIVFFDLLEYVSPFSRIFDFSTGMLIADIFIDVKSKKVEKLKLANLYEPLVFLIVMFTWIFIPVLTQNEILISVVYRLAIMSTIFIFAFESGFLSKLFSSKFFVTMGNLSMYVFLIHFPVILYFVYFLTLIMGPSLICSVICVILTIVITAVWVLCIHLVSKKKKKKNIETAAEQKTEIETQNEPIN